MLCSQDGQIGRPRNRSRQQSQRLGRIRKENDETLKSGRRAAINQPLGRRVTVPGLRYVTVRGHQTIADQKTCTCNARPDRWNLVTEPHMIGAVNVANRIPVTVQHNRRSGQFLFQLLDLLRQLADLCPQIIGTSFLGSSTRGMTSYSIHQHGDNRHYRQHLLAPVTITSSDPSLFRVQGETLDAQTLSVVALEQGLSYATGWTETLLRFREDRLYLCHYNAPFVPAWYQGDLTTSLAGLLMEKFPRRGHLGCR